MFKENTLFTIDLKESELFVPFDDVVDSNLAIIFPRTENVMEVRITCTVTFNHNGNPTLQGFDTTTKSVYLRWEDFMYLNASLCEEFDIVKSGGYNTGIMFERIWTFLMSRPLTEITAEIDTLMDKQPDQFSKEGKRCGALLGVEKLLKLIRKYLPRYYEIIVLKKTNTL